MAAFTASQRALEAVVPAGLFESLEAGTRQHMLVCPCGAKRDLWEAGGLMYSGNRKLTLARCPSCEKRTWQLKRRKTPAEKREEFNAGTLSPVFVSAHVWWASAMVWSVAALLWALPLFVMVRIPSPILLIPLWFVSFIIGWGPPYLWITTRYRIGARTLDVFSGPFRRSLSLPQITEVSRTRKSTGTNFAFDTDSLWVGYRPLSGAVNISPKDRELFLLSLARVCPHLQYEDGELHPAR